MLHAILLVAGVGKRLGADRPKSLLEFGGRSLLGRHLDALGLAGCTKLTVVVGHLEAMIRDEVARIAPSYEVEVVTNAHYREGSVVSLHTARASLSSDGPTIIMDGDVLYHPSLLARLRDEGGPSAFLVDTTSEETGEEMMVGVRHGQARRIARRVFDGDTNGKWDSVGESVGFLKVSGAHAAPLRAALEAHVDAGHRNTEYESVYDKFLDDHDVFVVPVAGAAWTEIDFEGDVIRAREEILPRLGQ